MGRFIFALGLCGWAILCSGCVDVEQIEREQERRNAPPPKVLTLEEYQDEELPGTERTMGPLDGEHLIVPIPDGWYVPPRNSKWIVRSQFRREDVYPSIIVTGGENTDTDASGEVIKQLGESNWKAYAKQLEDQLAEERKDKAGDDATVPEVSGLKVGRFYGVMYIVPAVSGGKRLDRLMIITIERGRKYTVELRTLHGTLRRFRPEAYAVAARLKVF